VKEKEQGQMTKKYHVQLTETEREDLQKLLSKGKIAVRRLKRAQILLAAGSGMTDERIASTIQVHVNTVERIRKRFVEGGVEHALNEDPRPGGKQKLDGKGEAVLVALACSEPPKGYARWTMQMLADRLVELKIVDNITDEAVRLRLKKTK
jgi:transposase